MHCTGGISPLLFCRAPYRCHFFSISSPSHIRFINLLFVHVIFKEGELEVENGHLSLHENKDDEDLKLKGEVGGGISQIKSKVCAMFLKLYATMPYTMALIVACGVLKAWRRSLQEVALMHLTLAGYFAFHRRFFAFLLFPNQDGSHSFGHGVLRALRRPPQVVA
jgi:hypothetical protein